LRARHSAARVLVDTRAVVATIDQRDFSIYRLSGRKRFRIVLSEPSR
jgi:hypothetical protein